MKRTVALGGHNLAVDTDMMDDASRSEFMHEGEKLDRAMKARAAMKEKMTQEVLSSFPANDRIVVESLLGKPEDFTPAIAEKYKAMTDKGAMAVANALVQKNMQALSCAHTMALIAREVYSKSTATVARSHTDIVQKELRAHWDRIATHERAAETLHDAPANETREARKIRKEALRAAEKSLHTENKAMSLRKAYYAANPVRTLSRQLETFHTDTIRYINKTYLEPLQLLREIEPHVVQADTPAITKVPVAPAPAGAKQKSPSPWAAV